MGVFLSKKEEPSKQHLSEQEAPQDKPTNDEEHIVTFVCPECLEKMKKTKERKLRQSRSRNSKTKAAGPRKQLKKISEVKIKRGSKVRAPCDVLKRACGEVENKEEPPRGCPVALPNDYNLRPRRPRRR